MCGVNLKSAMGKQRKGGVPYLKSSLRFDWDSSRGVPAAELNELLNDVILYLEEKGCHKNQPQCNSNYNSTYIDTYAGFGLQACLDLVKTEAKSIIFLDSLCTRPLAVANALGLYFTNYSGVAIVYCLPGIKDLLLNKLNRSEYGFVLKNCPEDLKKRLEDKLSAICIQNRRSDLRYTPVSLVKSIGKLNKVTKSELLVAGMVEATKEKEKTKQEKSSKDEKRKTGKDEKKDEMTEEDKKLEEDLNMLLQRLTENDVNLYQPSLETMRTLIRASTTSMTSVPKPLKFMRPHYAKMKQVFEKMQPGPTKGMHEPIGDWGHEYVRHLAMEMSEEWKQASDGSEKSKARRKELLVLARDIVMHNMKHNAEVEACDLLIEIERLDLLMEYVVDVDHQRVCLYLLSCAPLTPDPDNVILIRTAKNIYLKYKRYLEAVRCAIMLNEPNEIKEIFTMTNDLLLQKQMAILLGRHQIFLDFESIPNGEQLGELNSNAHLYEYFHSLARELDIMEPKTPEGIYKSHLEHSRPFGNTAAPDSARMNLAAAFVNGFVNCGFGVDKMMAESEDASKWFYKNKEYGMLSAAASQGLVWRWDIDSGLGQCDKFLYVNDDFIKAGTLLAIGIISSGIQDACDPASALLIDHIHSERAVIRVGSVLGLGLAYANSKRETVVKNEEGGVIFELKKVLTDSKPSATSEVKGLTGLALGLIMVGTADHTVAMEMLQTLMERSEAELSDPNMRFLALGIALIFLGTQEKSEVFVESLRSLPEPFGPMVSTLVDVCAFAGTGNVLKIQKLLHMCSEHYETEDKKKKKEDKVKKDAKSEKDKESKPDLSSQQAVAVLGIGLIAMGEDVGSQMALRMFGHLIRYGEPVIRRAVPLALALISVSNPQLNILETLSKFSHDADADTAHNAIFAMGLLPPQGSGVFELPFITCSYKLVFQVSLMLVLNNRQHYLLYTLVLAMQPRMLVMLCDDDKKPGHLKQIGVTVRVGQAVDIVAQAGKPKTITGFQTHTTPVLLAYGERAELANEEYIAMTPYLEGLVILKKNPDYDAPIVVKK
ncbi:Proteasome/cyclosome repeat protein [Dictyocaulus viviparus]|uniref:Proteasome/cyclosome repeat protein n=1 Tax=Dictyocaulus viviparus TaxID=29172 RepID=A0A0D8XU84_DICVI|nr:Proteasome/cyclosome repeat protein [Dictyocaulus viviparus]